MQTFILFALLIAFAAIGSGCQTATSSTKEPVSGTSASKTTEELEPEIHEIEKKTAEPETEVSLSTPSDAYRAAYQLRKDKDVAGLKKMMSKDILEFLEMMGEEEKKSLDEMIRDICEKQQADRAEIRNEKINGNFATVEYLTETGAWKTMDFEKVDGKWLLTFPKADKPNGSDIER